MNKQEIFDAVATCILEQGGPSFVTQGTIRFCSYRGQNGRKCAAGCLISDDDYTVSMEGRNVASLYHSEDSSSDFLRTMPWVEELEFVGLLQSIHDRPIMQASISDAEFFEVWIPNMIRVAANEGLDAGVFTRIKPRTENSPQPPAPD